MIAMQIIGLAGLLSPVLAETIHGAVVFTRHGDRTTKHYGAQALTSLGFEQNFQVGGQYRARYLDSDSPHRILGISESKYVPSQIYASAPDGGILLNTATAFLQGFYPPLESTDPDSLFTTLNNGSESGNPLDGYQYVTLHGVSADSPDTIWLKGDDSCPAVHDAVQSFKESDSFIEKMDETKAFYEKFRPVLSDVYDYNDPNADLTYRNAYDIFDLVNTARIHNASSAALDVSDKDLFQLRTLADSAEFGSNWDPEHPERSIHARTFLSVIAARLQEIVSSEGEAKFSLLAGSYDTMLAFFGLTGLADVSDDFTGLPDYASTFAFEVFSEGDEGSFPSDTGSLRGRFMFQNGTEGTLEAFPLFGREKSVKLADFVSHLEKHAIQDVGEWCTLCRSDLPFCPAFASEEKKGMSGVMAGGIAMLVIGAVATLASLAFVVLQRRKLAAERVSWAASFPAEKRSFQTEGANSV